METLPYQVRADLVKLVSAGQTEAPAKHEIADNCAAALGVRRPLSQCSQSPGAGRARCRSELTPSRALALSAYRKNTPRRSANSSKAERPTDFERHADAAATNAALRAEVQAVPCWVEGGASDF